MRNLITQALSLSLQAIAPLISIDYAFEAPIERFYETEIDFAKLKRKIAKRLKNIDELVSNLTDDLRVYFLYGNTGVGMFISFRSIPISHFRFIN
jgi:hypothetical protein